MLNYSHSFTLFLDFKCGAISLAAINGRLKDISTTPSILFDSDLLNVVTASGNIAILASDMIAKGFDIEDCLIATQSISAEPRLTAIASWSPSISSHSTVELPRDEGEEDSEVKVVDGRQPSADHKKQSKKRARESTISSLSSAVTATTSAAAEETTASVPQEEVEIGASALGGTSHQSLKKEKSKKKKNALEDNINSSSSSSSSSSSKKKKKSDTTQLNNE